MAHGQGGNPPIRASGAGCADRGRPLAAGSLASGPLAAGQLVWSARSDPHGAIRVQQAARSNPRAAVCSQRSALLGGGDRARDRGVNGRRHLLGGRGRPGRRSCSCSRPVLLLQLLPIGRTPASARAGCRFNGDVGAEHALASAEPVGDRFAGVLPRSAIGTSLLASSAENASDIKPLLRVVADRCEVGLGPGPAMGDSEAEI